MDVNQLALTWVGWPNGEKLVWLACKFDFDQSERELSQVNASVLKPWPNGVASSPKFSTCVYLRLRLSRALGANRKNWKNLKPWPNGVASRRQLKTWVYLRLHLARPCVHLRRIATTWAHFGRDQICTQVKASFSPFGHPTQVNASWVTSISLLLANEIQ